MLQYRDWYGTPYWTERSIDGQEFRIGWLVMHDTEGPRSAALSWWSSPNNPRKSSAHDLIDTQGVIDRCVPYEKAAHHAGGGAWPGIPPGSVGGTSIINLVSIGIELEYPAEPASPPWPKAQIDAAVRHVRRLVQIYGIPRSNVLRHSEVDPKNKRDPRNFQWEEFLNRVYRGMDDATAYALRNAAWNAGGIPYNREAAFPRYAREHGLGNPETPEFDFTSGGQQYRGQGFSKGIIYARIGDWGNIREVAW